MDTVVKLIDFNLCERCINWHYVSQVEKNKIEDLRRNIRHWFGKYRFCESTLCYNIVNCKKYDKDLQNLKDTYCIYCMCCSDYSDFVYKLVNRYEK